LDTCSTRCVYIDYAVVRNAGDGAREDRLVEIGSEAVVLGL
jgi:hypothetical protein